ncbi:hypothetical protein D3C80_1926090 [compost metagenome]
MITANTHAELAPSRTPSRQINFLDIIFQTLWAVVSALMKWEIGINGKPEVLKNILITIAKAATYSQKLMQRVGVYRQTSALV